MSSLLADRNGNEYDPGGLAWRYLGLYVDCSEVEASDGYEVDDFAVNDDDGNDANGGDDDDASDRSQGGCKRHLLWAAYVDPGYQGNAIEEYQLYDASTGAWDRSACKRRGRCARMDCHEATDATRFRLLGVFKQSDGMRDWATRLFEHEGYCLLSDNRTTHRTMRYWIDKWPTSCRELNQPDDYGNTLYIDVQPLPEGNVTMGIYTDAKCSLPSESINLERYIVRAYHAYVNNDDGYDVGTSKALKFVEGVEAWNENMDRFKVCQPCRAYNPFNLTSNGSAKYDCVDYAGYANANQCDSFETGTNLEVATRQDLEMASMQGTILRIKAYGNVYGEGGYTSPRRSRLADGFLSFAIVAAMSGVIAWIVLARPIVKKLEDFLIAAKLRRALVPASLREAMHVAAPDATSRGCEMKVFADHGRSDASTVVSESSRSAKEYEGRTVRWKANQAEG